MKIVAAGVMLVGLALMSAPLVLPRLGVTLGAAPAIVAEGTGPAAGPGGLSGVGASLSQGVRSVAALFGGRGTKDAEATTVPDDSAAAAADCAEAAIGAQDCAASASGASTGPVDPAAMAVEMERAARAMVDVERAPVRGSAPGAKFVKVAPKAETGTP